MQRLTFVVHEIVAAIVSDEIDNGSLREGCRLVENESSFFDASLNGTHVATLRTSRYPSNV